MPTYRKPDGRLWAALEQTRRVEINRALQTTGGQIAEAARYLGISRSSLYRECLRLNITYRSESDARSSTSR